QVPPAGAFQIRLGAVPPAVKARLSIASTSSLPVSLTSSQRSTSTCPGDQLPMTKLLTLSGARLAGSLPSSAVTVAPRLIEFHASAGTVVNPLLLMSLPAGPTR